MKYCKSVKMDRKKNFNEVFFSNILLYISQEFNNNVVDRTSYTIYYK